LDKELMRETLYQLQITHVLGANFDGGEAGFWSIRALLQANRKSMKPLFESN
jgi:hypothetical protein